MPGGCLFHAVEAVETILQAILRRAADSAASRRSIKSSRAGGGTRRERAPEVRNPSELRHQRDVRGHVASQDACPFPVAKSGSEQQEKTRVEKRRRKGKNRIKRPRHRRRYTRQKNERRSPLVNRR